MELSQANSWLLTTDKVQYFAQLSKCRQHTGQDWYDVKGFLTSLALILIADQMDRRESINASVNQDVAGIFNAKTYSQLIVLQKQINQKIASGDAVDIGNHLF